MINITEDMVTEFNQSLKSLNCSFKLLYDGRTSIAQFEIVPENNLFIESHIINPTMEFYKVLRDFFTEKGITLNCNNTGTIFWSTNRN